MTLVQAATGPSGTVVEANPTSADVVGLILYIVLALVFSFLCSIAEAALLNITPSYVADLQEKDAEYAEVVRGVRQTNIDQSLAAILTMNTIAHTVGAIGSGAKATIVFGSAYFGIFSAIMTLFILFLSEIIPKTIGVVYWRKLVGPVVTYIRILNFILLPFIWVSERITKLIAKEKTGNIFSRDEFVAMAGVGQKTGQLKEREYSIIQNLFRLASLTTKEIFTPRTVIVAFHEDSTVDEVLEDERVREFSRILIHKGDLDQVSGFVLLDEILHFKGEGIGETKLNALRRDILTVPIDYNLSRLLEDFLQKREQIAVVVDAFGTQGLVTIEDVLETLLGMEIIDETDSIEDMRKLAKQIWNNRLEALGIEEDKSRAPNESEPVDVSEPKNAEESQESQESDGSEPQN
ncbi:MAG: CNNM domain-containing protein [Candidatus Kariarchaeaceae archaeon]